MPMTDWLVEMFTLAHVGYFGLGVAATCAWHLVRAHLQRRTVVIKWAYIAVPLVVILAAYMAVQNQQNADCVREFNQTLRERAAVTSENDALSIEQRELLYGWLHDLVFPPPEIAGLDMNAPARQKWNLERTIAVDRQFQVSLEKQRENDARRAANPLPPPTCGL